MRFSIFSIAMIPAAAFAFAIAGPASADENAEGLSATALSQGDEEAAIAALERQRATTPGDPAVLINLGIAYAHRGDEQRARDMFEAALESDDVIELVTASGSETDSRRLARKAIRMLANGEFRPEPAGLSLND